MTEPLDTSAVAAARLWAVTRLPYLASAIFASEVVPAPGSGTIAIDRGWRICADPEPLRGLSTPDAGRLIVHLVCHALRDHAARAEAFGVRDDRRSWWQRCTDAEVNDDLEPAGCRPPFADTLPDHLGCPRGGLAETYFGHLPAETKDPAGWDCGSGADGRPREWDGSAADGLTTGTADLLRQRTAIEIRREEGRRPGSVPGGWLRWAETILPSRTDWRRVLAAEIRTALAAVAGNVDYTYRRISRRSGAARGVPRVIQPSMHRPVPTVAIVCDTSGSMGEDQLARVLAEVEALLARTGLRAGGVPVLSVDTEVQARGRVHRAAQVRLAGGGGTDMGAGIEAAAALRPRPDVVVVLTDGSTPWPDDPPRGIRVVVGLIRDEGAPPGADLPPWARTVLIDPVTG